MSLQKRTITSMMFESEPEPHQVYPSTGSIRLEEQENLVPKAYQKFSSGYKVYWERSQPNIEDFGEDRCSWIADHKWISSASNYVTVSPNIDLWNPVEFEAEINENRLHSKHSDIKVSHRDHAFWIPKMAILDIEVNDPRSLLTCIPYSLEKCIESEPVDMEIYHDR